MMHEPVTLSLRRDGAALVRTPYLVVVDPSRYGYHN